MSESKENPEFTTGFWELIMVRSRFSQEACGPLAAAVGRLLEFRNRRPRQSIDVFVAEETLFYERAEQLS